MILGDIMRFLFIYLVFLLGFSAAVVTLLIDPPAVNITKTRSLFEDCQKPTYRNFSYTTLELFKFTLGMGDLEFTEHYQYKEVFYVLLISYIILTYILLLNMLIRAITILDLEKGLPACLRTRLRSGVEKDLGSTGTGEDQRWCFRVEEVHWNKWNSDLGILNEDPGSRDGHFASAASDSAPGTGRRWRSVFGETNRRRPRHTQSQPSTEMRPLAATSPV
ncbi:hypothetical protein NHX12_010474 [Muraenolepis orangiensis]|uniref:Ion transport domain-containing protein n=1 Tax=Muraenolepis orangiensis TaxID=630683 RepID=A0A9Q0I8Y8_9TELE|nr:hypothetical protein NHX12_010474 [Muraenolepis orangiensis]